MLNTKQLLSKQDTDQNDCGYNSIILIRGFSYFLRVTYYSNTKKCVTSSLLFKLTNFYYKKHGKDLKTLSPNSL